MKIYLPGKDYLFLVNYLLAKNKYSLLCYSLRIVVMFNFHGTVKPFYQSDRFS